MPAHQYIVKDVVAQPKMILRKWVLQLAATILVAVSCKLSLLCYIIFHFDLFLEMLS
jgi:hypothetical protein